MNFKKEIEKSKFSYEDEWNYTSEFYHENGYYDILSNRFENGLRILEIGCGAGYSTISLSKKAKNLISIDENSYCINSTFKRLSELKIDASKNIRGEISADNNLSSYKMNYENNFNNKIHKVNCIEGDVLLDNELLDFLKSGEKFDLITCWMIGAHGLILNHEEQLKKGRTAINRQPQMVQDYKFDVLTEVAKQAKELLTRYGTLNIVERLNLQTARQFTQEQILDNFTSKIEPCGFNLQENNQLFEIKTRSKMAMVTPNGTEKVNMLGLLTMDFKKTIANKELR